MYNLENILITEEEYYKIEINKSKNRLYFTALGEWIGMKNFLSFEFRWKEGMRHLQPNFTVLADIRLMPVISKDLQVLFEDVQLYTIKNGVLHVAEVAAINDIANHQLGQISTRSHLPCSRFATFARAETYLNKISTSIEQK